MSDIAVMFWLIFVVGMIVLGMFFHSVYLDWRESQEEIERLKRREEDLLTVAYMETARRKQLPEVYKLSLKTLQHRIDRIHSEFERRKQQGLPYPSLEDLDRLFDA